MRARFPAALLLLVLSGGWTAPFRIAPADLPGNSIYQVESVWKQDDGSELRLRDLRGRTRVVGMFFSRCDNICPMLSGQLRQVERELPAELRSRVGFVLVTLDPRGDDVRALAEYRRRMRLSPGNWTLLSGSDDDTRELANLLGVTYMPKRDDGQIDHSGVIVVLDSEGRIVEKSSGIPDRKAFLRLLRRTAAN